MTYKKIFEAKVAFLVANGAGLHAHSNSGLLEHLLGTRQLLADWIEREAVCDAGLFHSIYGTQAYPLSTIDLAERSAVEGIIGGEAEQLVYTFCVMDRQAFFDQLLDGSMGTALRDRETGAPLPVTQKLFNDLCHIVLANWLEQRSRVSTRNAHRRQEFWRMRSFLRPCALAALDRTYRFGVKQK